MEAWFTLRRISNHQITQRRVACVMLSEVKHLWFVSVTLSEALTEMLRCAQHDKRDRMLHG
jgi:hypothetical protein